MHPFLTRLGVNAEVQQYFGAVCQADQREDLFFPYGNAFEHYGLGFHKVPVTGTPFIIGAHKLFLGCEIIVCASVMEGIAILHFRLSQIRYLENVLVICTGGRLTSSHIGWIKQYLPGRSIYLAFGNDLPGRVCDLICAAGIRNQPVSVCAGPEVIEVSFRSRDYLIPVNKFGLNTMEKAAGYRFNIRTLKPKGYNNFLDRLKAEAFI